jgi:hypothetical protein
MAVDFQQITQPYTPKDETPVWEPEIVHAYSFLLYVYAAHICRKTAF